MPRPLTPEALRSDPAFVLLGEFRNEGLIQFVIEYFLRRRSWIIWTHHAMSLAALAAAITMAVVRRIGVFSTLAWFVLSLVALLVVILPLHELAHAAAYRLIGARDIRWGFSTRMLAVWVTAHRFVARRTAFIVVALAPFVALNVPLIAAAVAWPQWSAFLLFALAWHLHGESGDFAILNFIWLHREHGFWTYDDSDAGVSYFYGRA